MRINPWWHARRIRARIASRQTKYSTWTFIMPCGLGGIRIGLIRLIRILRIGLIRLIRTRIRCPCDATTKKFLLCGVGLFASLKV